MGIPLNRIGVLLIIVAFMAVMVGCSEDNGNNGGNGGSSGSGGQFYILTVDSTAGGAVVVDGSHITGKKAFTYEAGRVVSLNAAPDSGYRFVRWTGTGALLAIQDVRAPNTTITMNGNYYIVAKFEVAQPVRYRLAIFSATGGSVITPGEDAFTYDAGTVVKLVAVPDSGYEFDEWTGDVDTIADVNSASTTIIMNGDYYICAHFRHIPCPGVG